MEGEKKGKRRRNSKPMLLSATASKACGRRLHRRRLTAAAWALLLLLEQLAVSDKNTLCFYFCSALTTVTTTRPTKATTSGGLSTSTRKEASSTTTQLHMSSSSSASSKTWSNSPKQRQQQQKYFARFVPRSVRGNRRIFEVQTAVTTFEKVLDGNKKVVVDLHGLLHFASRNYFDYFNSFHNNYNNNNDYDAVLYELLVNQDLLTQSNVDGMRRMVRNKTNEINNYAQQYQQSPLLMALPSDEATAKQYGLECQLNIVDYAKQEQVNNNGPDWIHADMTRQEFLTELEKQQEPQQQQQGRKTQKSKQLQQQQQQPLWALASSSTVAAAAANWPGAEALSALVRPYSAATAATSTTSTIQRRLFSNLFFTGDALTGWIRAFLWLTVPTPELSILLLDWSSLWPKPGALISPIAIPVLASLVSGNILEARQLVFGQVVVGAQNSAAANAATSRKGNSSSSANSSSSSPKQQESLLIETRNKRAMDVLQQTIKNLNQQQLQIRQPQNDDKNDSAAHHPEQRLALLYGTAHCPDLQKRLRRMGFRPVQTRWRTAWSVTVPNLGLGRRSSSSKKSSSSSSLLSSSSFEAFGATASPNAVAIGFVALPLYLLVGGLDWIATYMDLAKALEEMTSNYAAAAAAGGGGGSNDFFRGDMNNVAAALPPALDAILEVALYVIRHAALYLGLSKFVVQWDDTTNNPNTGSLFGGGGNDTPNSK